MEVAERERTSSSNHTMISLRKSTKDELDLLRSELGANLNIKLSYDAVIRNLLIDAKKQQVGEKHG